MRVAKFHLVQRPGLVEHTSRVYTTLTGKFYLREKEDILTLFLDGEWISFT